MDDTPKTQQATFGRRLRFLFLFRISPGFFVGFVPRRSVRTSSGFYDDYCYDDDMCIRRISEREYMSLRRLGIDEVDVMM